MAGLVGLLAGSRSQRAGVSVLPSRDYRHRGSFAQTLLTGSFLAAVFSRVYRMRRTLRCDISEHLAFALHAHIIAFS
jgi:hypothetical protein